MKNGAREIVMIPGTEEIDRFVLGTRGTEVRWAIPDPAEARLARGRIYYSAKIHGRDIGTQYKEGVLTLWVK